MSQLVRLVALLLCGLLSSTAPSAQTIYKSVGPDGRIVYGDKPPTTGHLEKTMKFADLPSSTLPPATAATLEQMRKARGLDSPTAANAGVTLYSASWCGYCRKAKAWLAAKGVAYQDVDVDTKTGMVALAQAGGGNGIPVLTVGDRRVTGFSEAGYDALFANRK